MPTPTPVVTVAPLDPSAGTREWLSTIATILAVIVALAIAVVPIVVRYLRRPRLDAEVGSREPNVRLARIIGGSSAWYLRMTIRNHGRTEARRVRVTLIDWYVHEPLGEHEWARNDTDPAALHWVSMTHSREHRPRIVGVSFVPAGLGAPAPELVTRPTPPEVNLAPNLFDLVDLMEFHSNGPLRLVLDDNRARGFIQEAPQPEREFMLTVVITAENASAVTKTAYFKVEAGKGFTNVEFRNPPKQFRNAGLLTMLDMVQQEIREHYGEHQDAPTQADEGDLPTSD